MAFKAHALKIGASWIGGILSQSFTSDAQIQAEPVAGSAYPQQTSIQGIKAGFRFSSYNVAAALGVLGYLGINLSGNTAELYEIQYGDDGLIVAGSTHRKVAFAAGRAIWRRISCSNQADASIEIEVFGLSADGLAAPHVFTEAVALPAVVDSARHTMGNVSLGGIALGCLLDISIDSGLSISSAPCTSNVWDTRMDLRSIVPKITCTVLDTSLVGSTGGKVNLTGAAATHANTAIRFRKRVVKTGTFVADATAEHIKITSDGIIVPTQPFQSSNNADGTTQFELTGTFDGTNLPLVINAASALP